jgi:glutathione peroxidase
MNALQNSLSNFKLLGVPCNQFGMQEPGANGTEIMNGVRYVRPGNNFQPNFEITEKIEVNGPNEHPLYTYLKKYCPSPWVTFAPKDRLFYDDFKVNDIRWNFEKFLIDQNGKPVMRYSETYSPLDIQQDIQQLLTSNREEN